MWVAGCCDPEGWEGAASFLTELTQHEVLAERVVLPLRDSEPEARGAAPAVPPLGAIFLPQVCLAKLAAPKGPYSHCREKYSVMKRGLRECDGDLSPHEPIKEKR